MDLYKKTELFNDAINTCSSLLNISTSIIEKDYFVTILLREIANKIPGIVFKGGTCLSKCFKIIDRFSEDIDLTLDEEHFTQSNKRQANRYIIKICDDLGFRIINRATVEKHSHGIYNCYEIAYPHKINNYEIIPYIKLELAFIQKTFPCEIKDVSSLIEESLYQNYSENYLKENGLSKFKIKVQSLERTFVDKVFAICDYYMHNEPLRQSRHIYDIYKLMPIINLYNINILVDEVRKERRKNKICLSAQSGVNISRIIEEFIVNNYFKKDYEEITYQLLRKKVDYSEAIMALEKLIKTNAFEERNN